MYYVIISEDNNNSLSLRLKTREAHLNRLKKLISNGELLIAGPNPSIDAENPGISGFTGSIIIAEFESLTDAELWAKNDPYVKAGVYSKVTVKPFKKVLP
jgi:hypothetical protein